MTHQRYTCTGTSEEPTTGKDPARALVAVQSIYHQLTCDTRYIPDNTDQVWRTPGEGEGEGQHQGNISITEPTKVTSRLQKQYISDGLQEGERGPVTSKAPVDQ